MKRVLNPGLRLSTFGFRLFSVLILATLLASSVTTPALTEGNPYAPIIGRNAFALKPPPPVGPAVPTVAPTPPPNVSLQGISTILGRAQVLLKVKIAPKPPEAAKELSLVMDVGQREGEVEVLEIDSVEGIVKLSNQGTPLTLSMKDNADKPIAGPPVTAPPINSGGAIPGIAPVSLPPPQTLPAAPAPLGQPMIPTRPVRGTENANLSNAGLSVAGPAQTGTEQVSMDRVAANVVLYEANRLKNEQLRAAGVKLPKMPEHTLLRKTQPETQTSK